MDVFARDNFLRFCAQISSDFERVRSYDLLELGGEGRDCKKDVE
jgi:hypothetical protein